VSVRHVGYPGHVHRKVDCRDFGMPPVSVSAAGPNSEGIFLANMMYRSDVILLNWSQSQLTHNREVSDEFKRTDTLQGDVGRKDAFVYVINANGPILLQYHVSAACYVGLVFVLTLFCLLLNHVVEFLL
jgi:hypothetical protein